MLRCCSGHQIHATELHASLILCSDCPHEVALTFTSTTDPGSNYGGKSTITCHQPYSHHSLRGVKPSSLAGQTFDGNQASTVAKCVCLNGSKRSLITWSSSTCDSKALPVSSVFFVLGIKDTFTTRHCRYLPPNRI